MLKSHNGKYIKHYSAVYFKLGKSNLNKQSPEKYFLLCCAVLSCSVMSDSASPRTVARQALLFMRILQARILEWVALPSSRGSSQPRDLTRSPALQANSLPSEPPGKPKNTGVGSPYLLQGIFLAQN